MYQPKRPSKSILVPVRHLQYHTRQWGQPMPGQAPLVMLHGWMDMGASWQFMVDAMRTERWMIAPDWRGFGRTLSGDPPSDSFWFPDYLADLDLLLDHIAPGQAVDLVGHSMGGSVAMMYSGVRPQRIRRLVNLEGFGQPATEPSQAPERYARWMDEVKALHRGEIQFSPYDSMEAVARRLMKTNPRLPKDKALWLAQHWAVPNASGQWQILGEAAHKVIFANLFRLDEVLAIHSGITAPVLSVIAGDDTPSKLWKGQFTLAEHHRRLEVVPQIQHAVIDDAAHMLHHDQPEVLAQLIDDFLASDPPTTSERRPKD